VVIGGFDVDAALLHFQHADVLDLRPPRLVVFLHAGMNALAAADAAADVQTVNELHAGQRRRVAQLGLDAVPALDFPPDASQHPLLVGGGHFLVVFLEELLERRDVVGIEVSQRRQGRRDGGRAGQRHGPSREEIPPV
jgi:hypothetical protein